MNHALKGADGQAAVPRLVYLMAVALSFALAGITVVLFLVTGPTPVTAWLAPPLTCAAVSVAFALKWPAGSWRWGVWLSSGFWTFFLVVFFSYLLVGELDWGAPARALSVVAAGAVSAAIGSRFRRVAAPTGN